MELSIESLSAFPPQKYILELSKEEFENFSKSKDILISFKNMNQLHIVVKED